ncbi:hypothetical protein ACFYZN_19900 [Streptomyces sp. NPDC001777]|uniref:hypothetical protein n=1 Tax=Streptomyces sp. NPDC001777 TaxID=3364608 RepID=UPI0036A5F7AC
MTDSPTTPPQVPDGRRAADDSPVARGATTRERCLTGHTEPVTAMATTSLPGRPVVVVSGSLDATVRVWDLATGSPVGAPLTGHTGTVRAVTGLRGGGRSLAVTGGEDESARVWDLVAHRPVGPPVEDHDGWVLALAATGHERDPLVLGAGEDQYLHVWHPLTRHRTRRADGHRHKVRAVASTDLHGRPVAPTAGDDSTIRVHRLDA